MFSPKALILVVATALAQTPAPAPTAIEIRGRVTEAGTDAGIEGVRVEISSFVVSKNANGTSSISSVLRADATTTGTGAFQLTLPQEGSWTFGLKKEGYTTAGGDMNLPVKADAPPQNVKLFMRRPATITGRVEDSETRQPLTDVPLSIESTARPLEGSPPGVGPSNPNTRTNAEGRFSYSGNPGSYVARVVPRVWTDRTLFKFTEQDVETIDEDFEDAYWPGGFEFSAATPVVVASAATGDIGTIRARKTKYYRLHVAFPAQGCEAGAKYYAKVTRQSNSSQPPVSIRELEYRLLCGQDALIKGLKPGSYRVELLPLDVAPEKQLWSLNRFEVTNKNVNLTAVVSGGPDLDGRFVAAEGAASLPGGLRAAITHRDWNSPAEMRYADADKEGRFHFPNVPVDQWNAGVTTRMPPGWVIADIRFRGVSLGRNLGRTISEFDWDGSGAIEIVLDDKPGSVRGTVRKNDKPVPDAAVLLYPLPLPPGGYPTTWPNVATQVKPDGSFSFDNLPAGDYRVFAVSPAMPSLIKGPEITTAFPAGSEKVTVPRGGTAQVDLRSIPDPK